MKYIKYCNALKRWCSLLLVGSLLCTLPNMMPLSIYGATTLREASSGEYFYTQLTSDEKAIYDAILNQIEELAKDDKDPSGVKVIIPKDSTYSISGKPIFAVFRDHPEYFWIDASKLSWAESVPFIDDEGNTVYELSTFPTGTSFFYDGFSVDNLQKYRSELNAKVLEIKKNLPSTAIDDVSKLKYLNNWIAANNVYNAVGLGASNFSRCAASGLLSDNNPSTTQDDPVCYGYATAMKVLLDAFEIKNAYIEGWAYNQNNISTGGEQHAWNYVELDDGTGIKQWYALDPTWDDPSIQSSQARQVYFLVGSNTITENALGEQYKTFGKNHDSSAAKSPAAKHKLIYPSLSTEARNPSADGNVIVKKKDGSTKGYDTLNDAMDDATSGDTLILQNQINIDNTITIKNGVTIDLNGQNGGNTLSPIAIKSSISPTFIIESGNSTSIINSGNFTAISMDTSSSKVIQNSGELTLGGNIQVSSKMASMGTSTPISGNDIILSKHTRKVATTKAVTIYNVAKPENSANGNYNAQQGETVQSLLNSFVKPTLDIKYYGNQGSLTPVPKVEYENCVWTISKSPNDGNKIQPQDSLENGIYTFTTEIFDYTLTYQVEVSGLTSAPIEINSIKIDSIDAPVAEKELDKTANVQTEGISISSLFWEPQNTGIADYNTSYTVVINLQPKNNYIFKDNVNVTINEKTADITKNQDGTITARLLFPATNKKIVQLESIQQPDTIQVANGIEIQDLPLPTQVSIITSDSNINKANIQWDKIPTDGTSYEPSKKTEQTFILEGVVELPEGVEANEVSLVVKINVNVTAADITSAPIAIPQGGTYTSNQTVELKSNTKNATIYYTLDGSEPFINNGYVYNKPILLQGKSGETVNIVLKTMAVSPKLQNSNVITYEYQLKLPSNSGTGSSSISVKPEYNTKPNNNTNTIVKPDGSKVETTITEDGSKTEVVTKPDGSQQIATTRIDGTYTMTTFDKQGKQTVTVELSKDFIESTINENTTSINLPIPNIIANCSPKSPATINIQVGTDKTTKVNIPVTNTVAGTVAVLVHEDGSKEIIPTAIVKENYMIVSISDNTTLEIMDNSKIFYDVPENGWQKNAVDFMSSRALFVGTGVDTYSPNMPTQRAMLITALARLKGQTITNINGNWYEEAMMWAKENGISDGSNPLQNLNREQLATMLYRYVQQKGLVQSTSNNLQNFTDKDNVSAYAKEAMQWAVENGILYGNGSQLLPQDDATRAEVSAAIMRLCENILS